MKEYLSPQLLTAFQTFCAERGWVEVPKVGEWEVLRMRHHRAQHPMLVYRKKNPALPLTVFCVGASSLMHDFHRSQR